MNAENTTPENDDFADLLAHCDEALAAGNGPATTPTVPIAPDLRPRLERGIACLHLLRAVLPHPAEATTAAPAPTDMEHPSPLPARVGRFLMRRELGRGSFGDVFLAYDPHLHREVALKVPRAGVLLSPELTQRFQREAEAAAGLDHPHIVPVYEAGEAEGVCYIASAYCPGPTLAVWLKQRIEPVPYRLAAELVVALAEAVEHAHCRGVLHRDLKPANVILESGPATASGREFMPRVTDFGLAKLLASGSGDARSTAGYETQSGAILGTPNYMAPEQATGQVHRIGPAADIYALGAILYELLTTRPPFQGESLLDTLEQARSQEPLPPSRLRPKLPRDLETICLKCLHKEPGHRYASAADLAEDLRRFLRGEPILARPVGGWEKAMKWARRRKAMAALLAVSALAALALVGVGVGLWYNNQLQDALREREAQRARAEELRDEAEGQRGRAEELRKEAEKQRARFELLQRQTRYIRDIDLAWQAWQTANITQVQAILDGPSCPPELRGWEWGYLRGLCHKEVRLLKTEGKTAGVAYSPDGRWLAAATLGDLKDQTAAGVVIVWETATWQKRWVFRHRDGAIHKITFSPDSRLLASAGHDGTIRVWDILRGQEVANLQGHPANWVRAVAFSPNDRMLAEARQDGLITLWSTATWQPLRTLPGHSREVEGLCFSPDGRRLASSGRDCTLRLWDPATGQGMWTQKQAHAQQISSVVFSPDGQTLATASEDETIKLWDLTTGAEQRTLRGHTEWVRAVAFHPDGERLASVGTDGTVRLWNVASGQEVAVFRGHTSPAILDVAFSPDGKQMASAGLDGTVRLWDATAPSQEIRILRQPNNVIHALAFASTSGTLATVGRDRLVRLWDPSRGVEIRTLKGHTGWITGVAFSHDGRYVASAGEQDGTVRLWEAATGKPLRSFSAHEAGAIRVAFSPDARLLASSGNDGAVKVWEVAGGALLRTFPSWGLAFSPDGRFLALVGSDHVIRLSKPDTGEEVARLAGHTGPVSRLVFSPDGRFLASTGLDATAKVWDVAAARELCTLRGHMNQVAGLAFSPDGRRIATCSFDRTVRLWDPVGGQEVFTLSDPRSMFYDVAFSPDGRRLAAIGATHGCVLLWEADPY